MRGKGVGLLRRGLSLQTYIGALVILATGLLGYSAYDTWLHHNTFASSSVVLVVLFILLNVLGSRRRVLVSESTTHVMGTSAQVATLILFGHTGAAFAAIPVIAAAKAITEIITFVEQRRVSWRATAVNMSAAILANGAGLILYLYMRGDIFLWRGDLSASVAVPSLLGMATTYYVVGMSIVTGAIMLTSEENPAYIFLRLWRETFLPEMSLVLTGVILAILYHYSMALSLFVILPVVLSIRSFESVTKLRKETVHAVVRMAESIEHRDTGTSEHSERIAQFTRELAEQLHLTPEHVHDIVLASRVHDLGKIGIRDSILLKPAGLTPQEFETMKQHTVIGSEILQGYSGFSESAQIVRHHHERWDGKGYPDGLKGEAIPIGSRIITVVDSFDAMTADRPYRRGMSVEDAVERLKQGMGTQFDPRICGVFIQMLIEKKVYLPHHSGPELHLVHRSEEAG